MLRSRIPSGPTSSLDRIHRGTVHDRTSLGYSPLLNSPNRLLRQHLLHLKLCAQPHSNQIDVNHFLPVLRIDLPGIAQRAYDAGEVGAIVDTSELPDSLGDGAFDLIFLRNVRVNGYALGAILLYGGLARCKGLFIVDVDESDSLGAFFGEGDSDCIPCENNLGYRGPEQGIMSIPRPLAPPVMKAIPGATGPDRW